MLPGFNRDQSFFRELKTVAVEKSRRYEKEGFATAG
jgi:hypothetical protein